MKKNNLKFKFIFLSILFLTLFSWAGKSWAAIGLQNGFWSTSFVGCTSGDVGYGDICDGVSVDDPAYSCLGTYSQITSEANYPLGGGLQGFRMFQGDVRNIDSTPLKIQFSSPQPEVWIRYYTRYPASQSWGGILEHKMIYAFTDSAVAMDVNFPQGEGIGLQPRNTMGSQDIFVSGWGWNDLYGGSVGDGSWHFYEHHFKLGSSGQNDGVYQFWVDGINRVNQTAMDFFNGGAVNPAGWSYVYLPSNHNVSALPGCNGIDIDDMAVAVPEYASFIQDSGGREMLGALESQSDIIPPAAPTGLLVN